MQSKRFKLWGCLLICMGLLSACHSKPKHSYYPENIQGQQVAFYHAYEGKSAYGSYHEDILYHFHRNGSFQSTLEGEYFSLGNFEYSLQNRSPKALLKLQYSMGEDQYLSELKLNYDSAFSGEWELVHTTDPKLSKQSAGSFRFIR